MVAVDYCINAVLYMIGYDGDGVKDGHINVAVYLDILLHFQVRKGLVLHSL
jgi:hypothetical protein